MDNQELAHPNIMARSNWPGYRPTSWHGANGESCEGYVFHGTEQLAWTQTNVMARSRF